MRREYGIPIVLWACAAAWVHTMLGGGGFAVATLHDDERFLLGLGSQVRDRVKQSEQAITVEWEGPEAPEESDTREAPPPKDEATRAIQKKEEEKKKASEPTPKPETPKVVAVLKEEEKSKAPPPELFEDKRVAVKQHAKPNQDDNPNARFLSEEANRVEKETHATQTNREEDNETPTPGGSHEGAAGTVGNSEKTKVREAEEHAGSKESLPGERGKEQELQKDPPPTRAMAPQKVDGPTSPAPPKSGGDGRQAASAAKAPESTLAPKTPSESPEVLAGDKGGWSFNPMRQGVQAPGASSANVGKSGDASKGGETKAAWLGLGGKPGPGQVNLNLSHDGVLASVGVDQLRKERQADGERRLSEHRGSWKSSDFSKWKSAIENYVAAVQPGNQTSLNAARSPFANYIHAMHLRIHALFADSFLDSLESLPPTHPMSNPKMFTRLEIVLNKEGGVSKLGIVKPSGVTAFDIAALDAVQRASPFGPVPSAIVSPDGKVYLHWEFHRDETACTTAHARPFILNGAAVPPSSEPPAPGGPPSPGEERGAAPVQHGRP
jgi:TonB family protein